MVLVTEDIGHGSCVVGTHFEYGVSDFHRYCNNQSNRHKSKIRKSGYLSTNLKTDLLVFQFFLWDRKYGCAEREIPRDSVYRIWDRIPVLISRI